MMNLNNYVENHGKKIITIFILIDQGAYCICNESKKTYIEAPLRRNLFKSFKCYTQLKIEKI